MLSSGLASSTMKSALLPAATMPSWSRRSTFAESRVAATIISIGVNPAATMLSNSRSVCSPSQRLPSPAASLPSTCRTPAAWSFLTLTASNTGRAGAPSRLRVSYIWARARISAGAMVSRTSGSSHQAGGPVSRMSDTRVMPPRFGGIQVARPLADRINWSSPARSRIGKAEANGADECSIRDDFGAQLVGQLAHVGAGADGRRDAVIGVSLQVVDVVLADEVRLRQLAGDGIEESGMAVRIDDRRHHGLAGEIDARRACRCRHLASSSDRRDAAVPDDESRILDGGAAVAGDEPCPLAHRRAGRPGRGASARPYVSRASGQPGGQRCFAPRHSG